MDREKETLVAAIRASTIYAAVVIRLPVAGEPLANMTAFADFIRGLRLPDSFAGWAIIGQDTDGSSNFVCRILFKALGSFTAAFIEQPSAQQYSPAIEYCDCFVDVQEKFVANIGEFCEDAISIAATGAGGMIPLWVPMTFVPGA
jgi:hypothetical protein